MDILFVNTRSKIEQTVRCYFSHGHSAMNEIAILHCINNNVILKQGKIGNLQLHVTSGWRDTRGNCPSVCFARLYTQGLRISGVNPPLAAILGEGGGSIMSSRSRLRDGRPRRDGVNSLAPGIGLGWPRHGDRRRGSATMLGVARLG